MKPSLRTIFYSLMVCAALACPRAALGMKKRLDDIPPDVMGIVIFNYLYEVYDPDNRNVSLEKRILSNHTPSGIVYHSKYIRFVWPSYALVTTPITLRRVNKWFRDVVDNVWIITAFTARDKHDKPIRYKININEIFKKCAYDAMVRFFKEKIQPFFSKNCMITMALCIDQGVISYQKCIHSPPTRCLLSNENIEPLIHFLKKKNYEETPPWRFKDECLMFNKAIALDTIKHRILAITLVKGHFHSFKRPSKPKPRTTDPQSSMSPKKTNRIRFNKNMKKRPINLSMTIKQSWAIQFRSLCNSNRRVICDKDKLEELRGTLCCELDGYFQEPFISAKDIDTACRALFELTLRQLKACNYSITEEEDDERLQKILKQKIIPHETAAVLTMSRILGEVLVTPEQKKELLEQKSVWEGPLSHRRQCDCPLCIKNRPSEK